MSEQIKDGGPAFPFTELNGDGSHYYSHGGMTLRDYFAAKAMEGDWAAQNLDSGMFTPDTKDAPMESSARMYYRMADAMLRAREVQP